MRGYACVAGSNWAEVKRERKEKERIDVNHGPDSVACMG